jgi:hypothetical protein
MNPPKNQPLAAIVTNGDASLLWLNREIPQLNEVRSAVERMIDGANKRSDRSPSGPFQEGDVGEGPP